MLSYISGTIKNKGQGYVIVMAGDLGYRIHVSSTLWVELDIGQAIELYLHHHIKEDAQDLYGFLKMDDLEMFQLLLSISGIGPKSALGVTSIADSSEIRESIAAGDPTLLTKVSGIGKKTAERVVLELRDKVGALAPMEGAGKTSVSGDEIDALMALGYSLPEAREALRKVGPETKDSGQRIREALRKLGK